MVLELRALLRTGAAGQGAVLTQTIEVAATAPCSGERVRVLAAVAITAPVAVDALMVL